MMDAKRKAIEARIAPYLGPAAAILLALAAGFFFYAMPAAVIGRAFDPAAIGGQGLLASLVALLVGAVTWAGFAWLDRDARPDYIAIAMQRDEAAPVLRRADAHPDAPPRRPIFAGSDLGTPLDLIDPLLADDAVTPTAFPSVPLDEPVVAATISAATAPPVAPEAVATPVARPDPVSAALPVMPAPSPAAVVSAQPLRTMLVRLEAGLARKALVLAGAEPNVTALRREIRPIGGTLSAAIETLQQRTAGRR